MPVTHVVNHEEREIRATAYGSIEIDDVRKHLSEELRDKGLVYRELIDASRATTSFSASDVRTIVELLRGYSEKSVLGPTAIIVGNDVSYGMIRMLAILIEDVCTIQPFRTRQEAEEWLGSTAAANRPTSIEPA
ncbi:MAG TPA: hypothetical protein VGF49_09595 [Candidatus Solibacter sp.]